MTLIALSVSSCGRSPRRKSRIAVALVVAIAVAALIGVLLRGQPMVANAGGLINCTESKDTQASVKAIKDLIAMYAKSIDDADTALASKIWLGSPDVSFIHPRGHERGWKEIKENVYEKLMGKTFSKRKLTAKDIDVYLYGDCAVAVFYWDFEATMRSDGSPLKTRGRESQIYRKGEHGWNLVHVHYSGMPVQGERRGF